ncbi:MAG: hypothetical protein GY755_13040, partial [Chloroflexi bacterium]|nr:hypothetical protein [Chloroflexota bacterium]
DACKKYDKDVSNICLLVTVQSSNLKEIPKIMHLAKDLGIKRVELNPIRVGPEKSHLVFNVDKAKEILIESMNLSKDLDMSLKLVGCLGNPDLERALNFHPNKCTRPFDHAYISYNGKLGPCNHEIDPPLVFGDLRKDSFDSVWNNSLFTVFRKLISSKKKPSICKWCFENRYD